MAIFGQEPCIHWDNKERKEVAQRTANETYAAPIYSSDQPPDTVGTLGDQAATRLDIEARSMVSIEGLGQPAQDVFST
ncbi:MAG: hypothetical protein ACR2QF_02065 [Geminicoccaceae bacterium]